MKQGNKFQSALLDWDDEATDGDVLWRAGKATAAEASGGVARITVPFWAQDGHSFIRDSAAAPREHQLQVRAYGPEVVRISMALDGEEAAADSPMLALDPAMPQVPLSVRQARSGWEIIDPEGRTRLRLEPGDAPTRHWSDLLAPPVDALAATVLPDGHREVELWDHDCLYPAHLESLGLAYVEHAGEASVSLFSVRAHHDEHFCGTGERFRGMDLAGQTVLLENADAMGVNSRRAYKNVPLYLSSRGYGLFMHTSAHGRLDLADVSTRAVQARLEEGRLDLFFIGGASLERVLRNYRRLTGFPPTVPRWSYGIWMSRMTYYSADETREVCRELRAGRFPCDVIHLDTGWFPRDWKCEWAFSQEKFPNPAGYMAELREQGFRVTVWNHPVVEPDIAQYAEATEHRYLPPKKSSAAEPGPLEFGKHIDFSYPEAVRWYQGLLEELLRLGVACIKTDFGEEIDLDADYLGMPARKLHNLYALLYQKAAFEVTAKVHDEPMIWARAGWAGCQRYPVHWGGDPACTWDGMAATIKGGLHLGLSGFGFWSHDVPGFHGMPDFMNSWPEPDLYLRWTQLGVFSSHMRYHGTSPREPYRYPEVADQVRRWWRLRYALIPYLMDQAQKVTVSGFPVLRAMVLHHQDDPACWRIDDQFFCGDSLLVAPVLSADGVRDVYLPRGRWVDLWTGEVMEGPRWLTGMPSPMGRCPVYAPAGAAIRYYPERVLSTDEMEPGRAALLRLDSSFKGMAASPLGELTGLI